MPICFRLFAPGPPGGLARRLHGREQESHEHADDRDDDEQLDQREAAPRPVGIRRVRHRDTNLAIQRDSTFRRGPTLTGRSTRGQAGAASGAGVGGGRVESEACEHGLAFGPGQEVGEAPASSRRSLSATTPSTWTIGSNSARSTGTRPEPGIAGDGRGDEACFAVACPDEVDGLADVLGLHELGDEAFPQATVFQGLPRGMAVRGMLGVCQGDMDDARRA